MKRPKSETETARPGKRTETISELTRWTVIDILKDQVTDFQSSELAATNPDTKAIFRGAKDAYQDALNELRKVWTMGEGVPTKTTETLTYLRLALTHALEWNESDIAGYDDITPTLEMLTARRKVLKDAIRKAKGGK